MKLLFENWRKYLNEDPALFTEVVGQASYYLHRGNFPEQKIAFLPGFDYFNLGKVEGYNIINKELVKL